MGWTRRGETEGVTCDRTFRRKCEVVLQLKDRHTHWEFVEELFTARPTILAPLIRCQIVATMSISGT